MNPSYSHMMIIHLFIRWYHIFFQATGKKRRKKEPPPPKKKTFCCADVAAWLPGWINRCFKYRDQGVQRESFCYTKIGSVCFKNQLLTLTKKEVLAIKTPHLYIHPPYPRSLVEVCVVWSLLICAGCEWKLHWVFPHIYWKQWPNACGKTIYSKLLLLKTKTKTGTKNICGT